MNNILMKFGSLFACVGLFILCGCQTVEDGLDESALGQSVGYPSMSLAEWRAPHGEWIEAVEVEMDPSDPSKLTAEPGNGILVNGPSGSTINLLSSDMHGDALVHIEFMIPKGSNSGVYFQGRYEIQVFDSWGQFEPRHSDCGGIYQRWENGQGFEGHAPRINASLPPGQWQSFDVLFRAPRFDEKSEKTENARFVKVIHNGVVIHENVEVTGPTRAAAFDWDEKPVGPLMLQGDHGPVAYKNLRIDKVNLD